ncbi:MAG: Ada metal-binding domain-containing protein [Pseudomonadota bacterium]
MINHVDITYIDLSARLRSGSIKFAGHKGYKGFGKLTCGTGKRMKREDRVFFASKAEAIAAGYPPCGNCMRSAR